MIIGIDISQLAYQGTGVAGYLENLVKELIRLDKKNKYILFFSSFRNSLKAEILNLKSNRVVIRQFKFPPTLLDFFWNRLHILPIESFIGDIDIFITSDWTEPPTKKAKKATILYDLIIYKYPEETHAKTEFNPFKFIISPNIVKSQKRKLKWVKKESDAVFCISKSTIKDAREILGIEKAKLFTTYPGFNN
ncbi:MAG: hypothetical protein A2W22_03440 [Candidatus Levybacteria bacterium RBG_16_35_11]|nr:MAG: hypothetical protein A2W22_03440 [Candidatus Levybacteria bacterium RBG_16_35_11]